MDSPETDTDRNGINNGDFDKSHYPLLTVENSLPRDGVTGKQGFYEVNGTDIKDEEGIFFFLLSFILMLYVKSILRSAFF